MRICAFNNGHHTYTLQQVLILCIFIYIKRLDNNFVNIYCGRGRVCIYTTMFGNNFSQGRRFFSLPYIIICNSFDTEKKIRLCKKKLGNAITSDRSLRIFLYNLYLYCSIQEGVHCKYRILGYTLQTAKFAVQKRSGLLTFVAKLKQKYVQKGGGPRPDSNTGKLEA